MPAPYIWTPPHTRRGNLPENGAALAGFSAGHFTGYLLWKHNVIADVPNHLSYPVQLGAKPVPIVNNTLLRWSLGFAFGAAAFCVVKAIRPSRNYWDAEIEAIDEQLDREAEIEEQEARAAAARAAASKELADIQKKRPVLQ